MQQLRSTLIKDVADLKAVLESSQSSQAAQTRRRPDPVIPQASAQPQVRGEGSAEIARLEAEMESARADMVETERLLSVREPPPFAASHVSHLVICVGFG